MKYYRGGAEKKKVGAEKKKVGTEEKKVGAEKKKVGAEKKKVRAEEKKVGAEKRAGASPAPTSRREGCPVTHLLRHWVYSRLLGRAGRSLLPG